MIPVLHHQDDKSIQLQQIWTRMWLRATLSLIQTIYVSVQQAPGGLSC